MKQYLDLMQHILDHGTDKADRTGTGTRSVFGHQMRFDLAQGFPLVTTKKMHLKSIIHELLWFLQGSTNIDYLNRHGVTIWDEWANEESGELGPVYGKQWRAWAAYQESQNTPEHIDQITKLIDGLRNNPDSRRHIVSAWNVADLEQMALPPCHMMFQCYVADGKLSLHFYMRSVDVFLGLPFNLASYAALAMMLAQVCNLKYGELVFTGGDCHLYSNHIEQARTQLARTPRPMPQLLIHPGITEIDQFEYKHFAVLDYNPHPHIAAPIAV